MEEQDNVQRKAEKEAFEKRVAEKKRRLAAKGKKRDELLQGAQGAEKEPAAAMPPVVPPETPTRNAVRQSSIGTAPGEEKLRLRASKGAPQEWMRAITDTLMTKMSNIENVLTELRECGGVVSYYLDPKDRNQRCEGELIVLQKDQLKPEELIVFEYGKYILTQVKKMLSGHMQSINLEIATSLPDALGNHTSFRNSFHWDPSRKTLYVRRTRLQNLGEFTTVILNCLAHILAGTVREGCNDASPVFMHHFYGLIELLSEELFFTKTGDSHKRPAGDRIDFRKDAVLTTDSMKQIKIAGKPHQEQLDIIRNQLLKQK